jgi:SlyX protein
MIYWVCSRRYNSGCVIRQRGNVLADSELVELQTQVAFQEDTIRQLNEALAFQQGDLTELKQQVELLKQQYSELRQQTHSGVEQMSDPGMEKPPHY